MRADIIVTIELPRGTHRSGRRTARSGSRRAGPAPSAVAGHDLLIRVTAWEATLEVDEDPAQTRIAFSADATSLRVHEGVGGMQELGRRGQGEHRQTIDDEVLKGTEIAFRSTAVGAGRRRPPRRPGGADAPRRRASARLRPRRGRRRDARRDGDRLKQSNWGMTPYSALFGALKVVDEVEIVAERVSCRAQSRRRGRAAGWSVPWDARLAAPGRSSIPRLERPLGAALLPLSSGSAWPPSGVARASRSARARRRVLHLPLRPHAGHRPAGCPARRPVGDQSL